MKIYIFIAQLTIDAIAVLMILVRKTGHSTRVIVRILPLKLVMFVRNWYSIQIQKLNNKYINLI